MPEAGEVLVRISQTTICGSDLYTLKGIRDEPTPTILGHEAIGHIVALPALPVTDLEGAPLSVGQRVTWSVAASCGDCDRCRCELPQKCRSLVKYGHAVAEGRTALSGGLAEYILLQKGSAIVALPQTLSSDVACPANCATATVVACIRSAEKIEGRRVLIFGAGMLGLTATALATSKSAASITVVDQSAERLEMSGRFGASQTVVWNSKRQTLHQVLASEGLAETYDVILELTGAPACVQAAIDVADIGANIVLAGSVLPSESVALDPEQVVRRWLTIRGVHNYAPDDLQAAVRFLETAQQFPFAELVGGRFPLQKVNEAVDFAIQQRPIRTAIMPSGHITDGKVSEVAAAGQD